MATKPSTTPEWATGGGAPVLEPLLAEKQAGWPVAFRPPAQWFNWWMRLVYQWLVWLEAFESEAHTWTALQQLNGRASITVSGTAAALQITNGTVGAIGLQSQVDNGVGVEGSGLAGVQGLGMGVGGVGGFFASAGGTGPAMDIEHAFSGIGLRVRTVSASPGTAIQVNGTGFYGIEIIGSNTIAIDIQNSVGSVGSVGLRTRAGLIGVLGRPAASTVGIGVRGEGSLTGAGVEGQGGSTGGDGVKGTAGGTGAGGRFSGGAGVGQALVAVGGTAGGVGLEVAGGGGNPVAIECVGAISLASATDPATSANVAQRLHRKQVNRCWALIALNGTATPTIVDAVGISGVTQQTVGNGIVDVTMAQAMANTSYGIFDSVKSNISEGRIARTVATSTTVFRAELFNPSAPNTVLTAAQTNGYLLLVSVVGAQP